MSWWSKIFILLTGVLLFACGKEKKEEVKLVDQLSLQWISTNSSSNQEKFIEFSEDNFKSDILSKSDTTEGKWQFNEADSTLTLTIFSNGFKAKIDSTLIEIEEGEVKLVHYSDGQSIVKEDKENITPLDEVSYKVSSRNNHLVFKSDKGTRVFHRPVLEKETAGFEFTFSSVIRGITGIAFLIFMAWLFSTDRKNINWSLVGKGLALQFIIALLVLKVPFVEGIFDWISKGFITVIEYTDAGVSFLFGSFVSGKLENGVINFAFKVLPTIVFFSALVSLFYYWGILQKIVWLMAWIMKKFMRLSGAESLAAAGNVFLGQTEAPLLVKPFLSKMSKSEIMCLMTGGMATLAGGVLAAYVGFLGGDDPVEKAFFAKHLLTASLISAPAAIIAAKILVPETEKINTDLTISKEKIGTNALEAISNGTTDGLKLAVNVGAMLIVFISIMALANGILGVVGNYTGLNEKIAQAGVYSGLSFEFILGYACRPLVWLIGVDWVDSVYVGELLGTKTVVNEFIGYNRLGEMKDLGNLSEKSIVMSTYILCGFANFASIGIQIGGIGSLVPTRKGMLSKLGVRALIGGTIACLMTAAIVGMTM